jgi:hypothetical protein
MGWITSNIAEREGSFLVWRLGANEATAEKLTTLPELLLAWALPGVCVSAAGSAADLRKAW